MLVKIDDVKLPEYAGCYLTNADASGIEYADKVAIDEWVKGYAGYSCLSFIFSGDQPEFCVDPAFGLPGDCVAVQVWGHTTNEPAQRHRTPVEDVNDLIGHLGASVAALSSGNKALVSDAFKHCREKSKDFEVNAGERDLYRQLTTILRHELKQY